VSQSFSDSLVWNDDGHELWLEINRHELVVLSVKCPGGPDCHDRRGECLVRWFVDRFGLECHVGVCTPQEVIKVAWAIAGDKDDRDESQVWIISVEDDLFAAWRSTQ